MHFVYPALLLSVFVFALIDLKFLEKLRADQGFICAHHTVQLAQLTFGNMPCAWQRHVQPVLCRSSGVWYWCVCWAARDNLLSGCKSEV